MSPEQKQLLEGTTTTPPTIILKGEVTPGMFQYVEEAFVTLRTKGSPDIEIVIDSGGGSTSAGLDIFDLIRIYPGKTTGIVVSLAGSIAAVILQACKQRNCPTHSNILIHHVSTKNVNLTEMTNKKKRDKIIAGMRKVQEQIYKIIEARSGKPRATIAKKSAEDKLMTAEEALIFGLIDLII